MVGAHEKTRISFRLDADARPPVTADVQMRPHFPVPVSDDDDRFRPVVEKEVVAGFRYLAHMTDPKPASVPIRLDVTIIDFGRGIEFTRQREPFLMRLDQAGDFVGVLQHGADLILPKL